MMRPEIIIRAFDPGNKAIKELMAGIEEEGVLCKVIYEIFPESEEVLGQKAAHESQLEVGIGLHQDRSALYIQKIKNTPLFTTVLHHRRIGQNAARYVKGNPLIEI